jgi:hypothetical protein
MPTISRLSVFAVLVPVSFALCAGLAGCADDDDPAQDAAQTGDEDELQSSKTTYASITETFKKDSDYDQWLTLRRGLVREFDNICGDTFCGGDMSDLRSVNLTCSATEKTGKVRECLWTFGGSYGAVDGTSGGYQSVVETFTCKFTVAASAASFLAVGAETNPLQATLPGQQTSIYDALGGCFQIKQTLPSPSDGAFVDAMDVLSDEQYGKFRAASDKLREGFDQVCGDTFCEGDYSDIEPLTLRCSVNPETQAIGSCAWTFAGAYGNVARTTGNVTSKRQTWTCQLPLSGNLDAALDALQGDDPLNAAIPGSDKTIYDSLVDCL